MKIFVAFLFLATVALQWPLWVGKGGVYAVRGMERELAEHTASNATFLARNEALENEVRDLKSGMQSVEEYARNDLGMVKEGEIFFQVVSDAPHVAFAPPAAPTIKK
jgi:cell division protein FtsB